MTEATRSEDASPHPACRVCGTASGPVGTRHSAFSERDFEIVRCPHCEYSFVTDPRTDFENLYDADYYRGAGADPQVDYATEIADPRTVRRYEWAGLLRIVDALVGITPETRWLDHGCGLGGAVRYALADGVSHVYGLEDGYAGDALRREGVPCITSDDIERFAGTFDVVTSIDVIEHAVEPVALLRDMASLLKPGGVLVVVTGNAEPFRDRLLTWSYTSAPDVHIGFFEPRTMVEAYERSGLAPFEQQRLPGYRGLIRYKVLKVLKVHSRAWYERVLPWRLVAWLADRRYKISEIPLARRPE